MRVWIVMAHSLAVARQAGTMAFPNRTADFVRWRKGEARQ
jgi:hypothetical protein